jgi:parallel beta-helix repeat protein
MYNNNPFRIKLFSLFLLLILINITTASSQVITKSDNGINNFLNFAETMYVDDDFNESTAGWGINRFDNIQDAINNALDGDIIYVYNGTYIENVIVNRSISLLGEDKFSTIINADNTGRVISITKNSVLIDGFTIRNSGNYIQDAGIYIESYFNSISNNILIENQNGLYLIDTRSNTMSQNSIFNCDYGIFLLNSDFNNIVQNTIEDHKYAIYIQESSTNDINGNILEENEIGLWLKLHCIDNSIAGNSFTKNSDKGILMDRFCYSNILHHNNFINNNVHATFTMSFLNTWEYNYWDNWIGLEVEEYRIFPKGIFGQILGPVPWINFDLYPLVEPHSIGPA